MKIHEFKYITDANKFLASNPEKKYKFTSGSNSSGMLYFLVEEDKGIEKFTKELKPE